MSSFFSLSVINEIPSDGKITKTHFERILPLCGECARLGDTGDWLSCHATLRSLAYSDPLRTSAYVRREAKVHMGILTSIRKLHAQDRTNPTPLEHIVFEGWEPIPHSFRAD